MRTLMRSPGAAILPALLFALMAILLVRVLPAPHSRLQYLIAGTLATTGALLAIFLRLMVVSNRRYRSE
jgi:hypothetical protein